MNNTSENNDNKSLKDKILDFARENKVKSVLIVLGISLFLLFNFNKKDKKAEELKKIETLYQSKDSNDSLYKAQYFKQIDPKIEEIKKSNEALEKRINEVTKTNKELQDKIVTSTKNQYSDLLEKEPTNPQDNLNKVMKNNYSFEGNKPVIPQMQGQQSTPQQMPQMQIVEWGNQPQQPESLLLKDEPCETCGDENAIKKKENENLKVVIPSASLLLIKLDNGMHLSTLTLANSHATPVTATVVSDVFMPSGRVYDVKGAKMVLEGIGSLSTERGYIKPLRISGFNAKNDTFDLPIQGYVSDIRTGIQGIQGEIISKQQALFWSSLVAYTVQGIGKGVSAQNQVVTNTAFGTTSMTPPDKIFESGILNGIGGGAQQVGDEILKIAKNIEPIVEVLGNQYAIVHTTMPFTLEYRIDTSANYDTEKSSLPAPVSNITNNTQKVGNLLNQGGAK